MVNLFLKKMLNDQLFWYTISSALLVVLFWAIQRHIRKTDALMERLTDAINSLNTNVAVLEERITALENMIEKMQ